MQNKPKIFISYAHEDIGMAKRIYLDLKRYGLDIWIDYENLLPGHEWEKVIKKTIRKSDYFIVLLSDKCLSKRGFVHYELKFSFEIAKKYFPSDTGIFIVPVRIDDCKPSDAYERLGKIHWIDVFPKSEYENGIRKILKVVSPNKFLLRAKSIKLSPIEVKNLIEECDFFDRVINPNGLGFPHQYKSQLNGNIILDEQTGLLWQQSGSTSRMTFQEAKNWVDHLNREAYFGFHDWRLPTLEEALSLMESKTNNSSLYIDNIFDKKQWYIWTCDRENRGSGMWVVYFNYGRCDYSIFISYHFVRAVRSI